MIESRRGASPIPPSTEVTLPPDLVLVGVLPPLLYSSGFFTSLRDVRANAQSITLLATGLVAATMAAVAVVAHEVVGLAWAPAFVLGAVVAPTDPIAATAIARRLGVPRRGGGGRRRNVLVRRRGAALPRERRRRDRRRPRRRLARRARPGPSRQHPGGDRDLAPDGLPRLHPGDRAPRLRRAGGGHGGRLPRLAGARAFYPRGAGAGKNRLGDARLPRERAPLRARRPAAAADSRRALGAVDGELDRLCRARDGDGHGRPPRMGLSAHLPGAPAPLPPADTRGAMGRGDRDRLDGDARRGLAGGGAGGAAQHRHRRSLPLARAHRVPGLLRHPRHARGAGPDPSGRDPHVETRGGHGAGAGGGEGAAPRGRRGARAARGAPRRGLGPGGHGRPDARSLQLPPQPLRGTVRRR